MAKVLYVTANPKEESKSYGLQVGHAFMDEYKAANPGDEVIHIDVFKDYIPMIDEDIFAGWEALGAGVPFNELTPEQQKKVGRFGELTDQFVSADKYVFVTPMWNLGIPAQMKAYIDTAVIAGKTFNYTASGPVGLLEGKKAVHIHASGGVYSEGPAKPFEHGDSYVRTILNFIGVADVNSIYVEGMAYDPSKAEDIKLTAIAHAKEVAKQF